MYGFVAAAEIVSGILQPEAPRQQDPNAGTGRAPAFFS
jgi:hypothetical protein